MPAATVNPSHDRDPARERVSPLVHSIGICRAASEYGDRRGVEGTS
jgi:hypothetical protein